MTAARRRRWAPRPACCSTTPATRCPIPRPSRRACRWACPVPSRFSRWRTRSTASCRGRTCSVPSIAAARDGFAVSPRLAAWLDIMKVFRDDPSARATYFNADGSPKKLGRSGHQSRTRRHDAAHRQRGRARVAGGADRRGDGGAGARQQAAGHAGALRSGVVPRHQARAGLWALSRLDRVQHAAALLGRHRDAAIAGAARTVRSCAGQAQRSAGAASDCRGGPARLRRPRTLRRRSGLRAGADGGADLASLHRRAAQADLRKPQHGRAGRAGRTGLYRTRHQPHDDRRSRGQRRRLHHHHRGAVRRRT